MMRLGESSFSRVIAAVVLATLSSVWATEPPPTTFSGKVIDPNGRPSARAKVSSYGVADGPLNGTFEVRRLEETTTGADGVFSFKTGTSPVHSENVTVACKPGWALGWAFHPKPAIARQEVMLGRAGRIDGLVVDPNGKPLADARVFASAVKTRTPNEQAIPLPGSLARQLFAATTDVQGRFVLSDVPLDAEFELAAQKAGYATVVTIDRCRAEAPVPSSARQPPIVMVAPAQACIEGTVVERETGKPIEGVGITLKSDRLSAGSQPAPIQSQADGRFRFEGLPPGRHVLSTGIPWKGPAEWVAQAQNVTLAPGELKKDVKVEVGKGGLLEITVKANGADKPIPHAPLGLQDAQGGDLGGVLSDVNGVARVRLRAGKYGMGTLFVSGYITARDKQRVVLRDGQVYRATVGLDEQPRITGVVRDPNGRPVAGVLLSVPPQDRMQAASEGIVSDTQGRFTVTWDPRFEHIPWGSFYLLARDPQRDLAAVANIDTNIKTLDVNLAPAVTFTGKVVDPDGKGIAGADFRVSMKATYWDTRTDANGDFQIRGIPAIEPNQAYGAQASAERYGYRYINDIPGNRVVNRRVSLEPFTLPRLSASLSGQVIDGDDHPVSGAVLSAYGQGQSQRAWAGTDAGGRFVISDLCPGEIEVFVYALRDGQELQAYARTRAGAGDIRIVAQDYWTNAQILGIRTYEEITSSGGKYIAGKTVDDSGKPIAGVLVQLNCHEKVEDGNVVSVTGGAPWLYHAQVTSDKQGRFAVPTQEDGWYNILFKSPRHAATIVYDVPVNTKDLRVVLAKGGTLAGRLLRMEKGQKVPIPYAPVKIEQPVRGMFNDLKFDRTVVTDAQGRFRFEHLQTKIRPGGTAFDKQWSFELREWNLTSGDAKATIVFAGGDEIKDFELIDRPELNQAKPLLGDPVPSLDDLKAGVSADQLKGKAILVCLFDFQQRPSRNAFLQLARRADELKAKDIAVIAVEVSETEKEAVAAWTKQNNVSIPVAVTGAAAEETRFIWSAKALPWLILTDKSHVVTAEGFAVDELSKKIEGL